MKLIIRLVFKYGGDDKKVETEIFIHSINKKNYAGSQF